MFHVNRVRYRGLVFPENFDISESLTGISKLTDVLTPYAPSGCVSSESFLRDLLREVYSSHRTTES